MQQTIRKQHYKFTLYRLDTYYSTEYKTKMWGSDKVCYREKTWVNQSSYEEVFSLEFTDEEKLKIFLRNRYKHDYIASFYTCLGTAIKNCDVHNAMEYIAIVSTSHTDGYTRIGFELRKRKKDNKYPKRRNSRYRDYYRSSYDWLAKEIKRKHIDNFIQEINQL